MTVDIKGPCGTLSEWERAFGFKMAFSEVNGHIMLDKFGGDNFNLI